VVETTMVTAEAYTAGFSVIMNIEGVHILKLWTIEDIFTMVIILIDLCMMHKFICDLNFYGCCNGLFPSGLQKDFKLESIAWLYFRNL